MRDEGSAGSILRMFFLMLVFVLFLAVVVFLNLVVVFFPLFCCCLHFEVVVRILVSVLPEFFNLLSFINLKQG